MKSDLSFDTRLEKEGLRGNPLVHHLSILAGKLILGVWNLYCERTLHIPPPWRAEVRLSSSSYLRSTGVSTRPRMQKINNLMSLLVIDPPHLVSALWLRLQYLNSDIGWYEPHDVLFTSHTLSILLSTDFIMYYVRLARFREADIESNTKSEVLKSSWCWFYRTLLI